MVVVYSFDEFKSAIKAGEKDILIKGCGKKLLSAFAVASVCASMGITTTAGIIASAGAIGAAVTVPIPIIIASAVTIVAIIALCRGYNIEVDWKNGWVHVKIRKE